MVFKNNFSKSAILRIENDQDKLFEKIEQLKAEAEPLNEDASKSRNEVFENGLVLDGEGDVDPVNSSAFAQELFCFEENIRKGSDSVQEAMAGVEPNSREHYGLILEELNVYAVNNHLTMQAVYDEGYVPQDVIPEEAERLLYEHKNATFELIEEFHVNDLPSIKSEETPSESEATQVGSSVGNTEETSGS